MKERGAKRMARESEESKLKERNSPLKRKKTARQSNLFKIKEGDPKRMKRESEENILLKICLGSLFRSMI